MKIAIDIRSAGGEKAGKGWYTFHTVYNLIGSDTKNEYVLYAKNGIAGFEQFKNVRTKIFDGIGIFWHIKVARDVAKEKIDVFFAPSSYIIPNFLPDSVKTILTVHDLVAFLFPSFHNKKAVILERLLLKRALKKSCCVVAVSKNTKKDLITHFKYPKEKIEVIGCAGSDSFKPLPKESLKDFFVETNLPKKFFLAVGTLEPRKNYANLIEAFAKLNKVSPDVHLIIVGKNGWGYEEIYTKIRENYLQKKVHILGYLSENSLMKLYNLALALVFPSIYEGFGIPPLEAMKSGCPVITSYSSSLPEVVGDSAILINPYNQKEIAGAMLKLLKNDDLRKELSASGLVQAKKFSWEESGKKLKEVINRIS